MEYIIRKGNNSAGPHFNLFAPKIIEGTIRIDSSCLYWEEPNLTPRELTSWQKIIGTSNALTFGKDSGRLAFRSLESKFQLGSYVHDRSVIYDPIKNPGRVISVIEPDTDSYFRLEEQDYKYVFTVNDIKLEHPKSTKCSLIRYMNLPWIELGDKPAPHDFKITITRK